MPPRGTGRKNPLILGEDESFSLTANVTSPGYQSVVLKGYLISERPDGTYVAPLIPQLFYGADGTQLTTWRQNLPTAGSQVILSRAAGGYPKVPREELYWRKVKPKEEEKVVRPKLTLGDWWNSLAWWQKLLVVGSIAAAVGAAYLTYRGRKKF